MSNINKQALREAAKKATGAHDRLSVITADDIFDISLHHDGAQIDADITALNAFNEAANPATVLALLDELEAAEKLIAEFDQRIRTQNRHACELFDEAKAQRQRTAELEASHSKLRESMAAIHNTIHLDGVRTSLTAMMGAAKRAHDESSAAAGISIKGE